jgi:hypothetical protein
MGTDLKAEEAVRERDEAEVKVGNLHFRLHVESLKFLQADDVYFGSKAHLVLFVHHELSLIPYNHRFDGSHCRGDWVQQKHQMVCIAFVCCFVVLLKLE